MSDFSETKVDAGEEQNGVMNNLEAVIENVQPATEFTNTRKCLIFGLLLSVFSIVGLAVFKMNEIGVFLACLFILVFSLVVVYQHRNAGKTPFMRLTRNQLWVDSLSAPVELTDVVDFNVTADLLQIEQTLYLRPDVTLPTHKVIRQFFPSQAQVFGGDQPRITITSAGLKSAGKKVNCDDMMVILNDYIQAAYAQRHLQELRGQKSA